MPAATLLRAGDVLGGFRVEDVIGIGGMAIVYRAVQISLGRPVALKVLSSELSNDAVFRERFRREGAHAAGQDHAHIVPVFDSGEEHGYLYMAMRLVEGTNLAEKIERGGLTADETISILRPVASALDSAHATELIHRDIKPQNILIARDGHPYLADFGIAKRASAQSLTQSGWFVGSVNFASPEQIADLALTPASDIYSLTAVLFQCLTGEVPYPRASDASVMQAHLKEPPPKLPGPAGKEFDAIFARGMAKDPQERFRHAGDLLNAVGLRVRQLPSSMRETTNPFASARDAAGRGVEATVQSADMDITSYSPGGGEGTPDGLLARPRITQRRPTQRLPTGGLASDAPELTHQLPRQPRASSHRWRRLGALAGLGVGLLIAALAVIFSSGPSHAKASSFRSGSLALSTDGGWRPATSTLEGLELESPISIATSTASLLAGRIEHPAPVAGGLPTSLVKVYGQPTRAGVVELPLGLARRFTWSGPRLAPLTVWVLATGAGELAIACGAELAAAAAASLSDCGKLLADARIVGASVEYPGADPKLAKQIADVIDARGSRLSSNQGVLSSERLTSRASALTAVAAADSQAARSLNALAHLARYRAPLAALATAFKDEAAFAREAGDAARSGRRSLYESLRRGVASGHDRLRSAALALRARGFQLQSPSALWIRALPVHKAAVPSIAPATSLEPAPPVEPSTSVSKPSPKKAPRPSQVPVPTEVPVPTKE